MKPLEKDQIDQLQHAIMNGLTPVRNYLEILKMQPTVETATRALTALDALRERLKMEFEI